MSSSIVHKQCSSLSSTVQLRLRFRLEPTFVFVVVFNQHEFPDLGLFETLTFTGGLNNTLSESEEKKI